MGLIRDVAVLPGTLIDSWGPSRLYDSDYSKPMDIFEPYLDNFGSLLYLFIKLILLTLLWEMPSSSFSSDNY